MRKPFWSSATLMRPHSRFGERRKAARREKKNPTWYVLRTRRSLPCSHTHTHTHTHSSMCGLASVRTRVRGHSPYGPEKKKMRAKIGRACSLSLTLPPTPNPTHRLSPARSRPRACPPSSWCWSATAARVSVCGKGDRGLGAARTTHRPASEKGRKGKQKDTQHLHTRPSPKLTQARPLL